MFLLSSSLSIVKLFQYQVNYEKEQMDYPMVIDPVKEHFHDTVLVVFEFLHDLANYLVFSIFNIAIEVIIVRKLRKELKDKEERTAHMVINHSINSSRSFRHKKKSEAEVRKTQANATMMTCINGLLNSTLRLPEITLLIYLIFSIFYPNSGLFVYLCTDLSVCQIAIDLVNIFYILTFTGNFFIYYFLNKNSRCMLRFYS
jgi:hypothetical protein